jgi:zinc and cadmium transporter
MSQSVWTNLSIKPMINFLWALGASLTVSLISLVGIISLLLKERFLQEVLLLLVGFSAGGLIGGAFLHLLPEAIKEAGPEGIFLLVVLGFVLFFVLERYIHWRHCHLEGCKVHIFSYLNLVGDGIHNFMDGLAIGASFTVSLHFGVVTSLVIIFHEIPQEIGDFGVLLYGGFSRWQALIYNFLTALLCVLGVVCGYPLASKAGSFAGALMPLVAGGFIYIAGCDLLPQLHKEMDLKKSTFSLAAFLCGIGFVLLAKNIFSH